MRCHGYDHSIFNVKSLRDVKWTMIFRVIITVIPHVVPQAAVTQREPICLALHSSPQIILCFFILKVRPQENFPSAPLCLLFISTNTSLVLNIHRWLEGTGTNGGSGIQMGSLPVVRPYLITFPKWIIKTGLCICVCII